MSPRVRGIFPRSERSAFADSQGAEISLGGCAEFTLWEVEFTLWDVQNSPSGMCRTPPLGSGIHPLESRIHPWEVELTLWEQDSYRHGPRQQQDDDDEEKKEEEKRRAETRARIAALEAELKEADTGWCRRTLSQLNAEAVRAPSTSL